MQINKLDPSFTLPLICLDYLQIILLRILQIIVISNQLMTKYTCIISCDAIQQAAKQQSSNLEIIWNMNNLANITYICFHFSSATLEEKKKGVETGLCWSVMLKSSNKASLVNPELLFRWTLICTFHLHTIKLLLLALTEPDELQWAWVLRCLPFKKKMPSTLKRAPSPSENAWFTHTVGVPLGKLSWETSTT